MYLTLIYLGRHISFASRMFIIGVRHTGQGGGLMSGSVPSASAFARASASAANLCAWNFLAESSLSQCIPGTCATANTALATEVRSIGGGALHTWMYAEEDRIRACVPEGLEVDRAHCVFFLCGCEHAVGLALDDPQRKDMAQAIGTSDPEAIRKSNLTNIALSAGHLMKPIEIK